MFSIMNGQRWKGGWSSDLQRTNSDIETSAPTRCVMYIHALNDDELQVVQDLASNKRL
jgi:hypothetical protein